MHDFNEEKKTRKKQKKRLKIRVNVFFLVSFLRLMCCTVRMHVHGYMTYGEKLKIKKNRYLTMYGIGGEKHTWK